jgi:hypothetical protein
MRRKVSPKTIYGDMMTLFFKKLIVFWVWLINATILLKTSGQFKGMRFSLKDVALDYFIYGAVYYGTAYWLLFGCLIGYGYILWA